MLMARIRQLTLSANISFISYGIRCDIAVLPVEWQFGIQYPNSHGNEQNISLACSAIHSSYMQKAGNLPDMFLIETKDQMFSGDQHL
jgi:hypothetical protein